MFISWNEQEGLSNLGETQELVGEVIPAEPLSNAD